MKRKLDDDLEAIIDQGTHDDPELGLQVKYTGVVTIYQSKFRANIISNYDDAARVLKAARGAPEWKDAEEKVEKILSRTFHNWQNSAGEDAAEEDEIIMSESDPPSSGVDELKEALGAQLPKVKVSAGSKNFSKLSEKCIDGLKLTESTTFAVPSGTEFNEFVNIMKFVRELYFADSLIRCMKEGKIAHESVFTDYLEHALNNSGLCRAICTNKYIIANTKFRNFPPSHGKPGDICVAFAGNVFRVFLEVKRNLAQRSYWAEALAEVRALSESIGSHPVVILISPFHMTLLQYSGADAFRFQDVDSEHWVSELYATLRQCADLAPDEVDEGDVSTEDEGDDDGPGEGDEGRKRSDGAAGGGHGSADGGDGPTDGGDGGHGPTDGSGGGDGPTDGSDGSDGPAGGDEGGKRSDGAAGKGDGSADGGDGAADEGVSKQINVFGIPRVVKFAGPTKRRPVHLFLWSNPGESDDSASDTEDWDAHRRTARRQRKQHQAKVQNDKKTPRQKFYVKGGSKQIEKLLKDELHSSFLKALGYNFVTKTVPLAEPRCR